MVNSKPHPSSQKKEAGDARTWEEAKRGEDKKKGAPRGKPTPYRRPGFPLTKVKEIPAKGGLDFVRDRVEATPRGELGKFSTRSSVSQKKDWVRTGIKSNQKSRTISKTDKPKRVSVGPGDGAKLYNKEGRDITIQACAQNNTNRKKGGKKKRWSLPGGGPN